MVERVAPIIISDFSYLADRIQIFSKERELHTDDRRGRTTTGMLLRPRGIALTEQLSLVVVSHNENFTFQIFSCQ